MWAAVNDVAEEQELGRSGAARSGVQLKLPEQDLQQIEATVEVSYSIDPFTGCGRGQLEPAPDESGHGSWLSPHCCLPSFKPDNRKLPRASDLDELRGEISRFCRGSEREASLGPVR